MNRRIVHVQQGSPEWLKLKSTRYGGSESAAMLGLDPHRTRDQLLHEKATGIIPEVSPELQVIYGRGHETEEAAIAILEEEWGEELYPLVWVADIEGLPLIASLDGMPMDHHCFVEHKQWNKILSATIRCEEVPDSHWPQLEHGLLVADPDLRFCILVCSDGTKEKRVYVHYRSVPERRQRLIDGWKQFHKDLQNYKIPEPIEKPDKMFLPLDKVFCDVDTHGRPLDETQPYLPLTSESKIRAAAIEVEADFTELEIAESELRQQKRLAAESLIDRFIVAMEYKPRTASQIKTALLMWERFRIGDK